MRLPSRFAVADGATESAFARLWARQLVRAYCHGRLRPEAIATDILPVRQGWIDCLSHWPLPWYTEEKIRLGAYSTLAGLALEDGRWHAIAVGDSCLFQVRGDRVVRAFPIEDVGDFGTRPALLGSVAGPLGVVAEPLTADGPWLPGDVFYLMTDALAQWFLQSNDDGERVARLAGVDSSDAFARLVSAERAEHDPVEGAGLANDDTTMVRVQPLGG